MQRRDFLKKGLLFTAGSALIPSLFHNTKLFGRTDHIMYTNNFDLVALKGGEPDEMFNQGIASLGGMKNFVKKNQKVVVKPNIGWDVEPERAANTNPMLVKRVVEHCFNASAKEVYVFDHTCDEWKFCYKNSGIEKAAKDAGAKIVPGNYERYYHDFDVKNGKRLKNTKIHELILESDVFINVPILKNHGSTQLSLAMKNLMGIVWDRGFWHRNDLHQCIADLTTAIKPDLNIIDSYYMLKKNGPRGVSKADVVKMKTQLISTDIVAADSAAAKIFGKDPESVGFIRIADEMKVGSMHLDKLNINRIKI